MQKRVLPIALALIIAAAGTLAVAASNYTTKQVMAQAFKGGLLKKVVAGDATDAERTTLLAMLESLAQNKPKKGGADSWKAKTSALLEAAKANDGEKLKAAAACAACHNVHK
ncbi:MAG: hypothetical protein KDB14_06280 [Planctomycetales bacterium]|nr:hypothetical protein [Planctomycetales bacterium]